jgi:hypothetical protein
MTVLPRLHLVGVAGLEPATLPLKRRSFCQLNYTPGETLVYRCRPIFVSSLCPFNYFCTVPKFTGYCVYLTLPRLHRAHDFITLLQSFNLSQSIRLVVDDKS